MEVKEEGDAVDPRYPSASSLRCAPMLHGVGVVASAKPRSAAPGAFPVRNLPVVASAKTRSAAPAAVRRSVRVVAAVEKGGVRGFGG